MSGPTAATTPDGSRLHLHHGPIDLIVEADGAEPDVAEAYRRAWARFQPLLDELVEELPALRTPVGERRAVLSGSVARRMDAAVSPFSERFITPMAAVAGAVADEICAEMASCDVRRAYVNDGGDIAMFLQPDESFDVGLVPIPHRPSVMGTATVRHGDPIRGVATSGRHGRSFSLGIADAVTVLARTAADADAAATLIANAVDLPGHPGVRRAPARELQADTDLGNRPVTVAVGALAPTEAAAALERGAIRAETMRARGLIAAAALFLAGDVRIVGALAVDRSQEAEAASA
jgi:uncharacterized protein